MIPAETLVSPSQPSILVSRRAALVALLAEQWSSVWRATVQVLLGVVLAAAAGLIPGAASRLLETGLTWSDVLGARPRPARGSRSRDL